MTESFVIQADISNMPQVEERLFHFCRECNVGSYYSTISVATLQAVENAIVHGDESDESKAGYHFHGYLPRRGLSLR